MVLRQLPRRKLRRRAVRTRRCEARSFVAAHLSAARHHRSCPINDGGPANSSGTQTTRLKTAATGPLLLGVRGLALAASGGFVFRTTFVLTCFQVDFAGQLRELLIGFFFFLERLA